jgi:hypothetical protein
MDVGEDEYVGFLLALNFFPLRISLVFSSQSKTIVASIAVATKVPIHTLVSRRQVEAYRSKLKGEVNLIEKDVKGFCT